MPDIGRVLEGAFKLLGVGDGNPAGHAEPAARFKNLGDAGPAYGPFRGWNNIWRKAFEAEGIFTRCRDSPIAPWLTS